jgi:hypothetical protein
MYNQINFDFPNNTAFIRLNGVEHLFKTAAGFAQLTGYPFTNTITLSYEPHRNMFFVERLGGIVISGEDSEEIKWCSDNIDLIISKAYEDGYGLLPPGPSLQEIRNTKLYETDWMVTRHNDQTMLGITTTLSEQQFMKLLNYRQQLRDITNLYTSIDDVIWPLLDL